MRVLINKLLKQHKFRIMAKSSSSSRSLEISVEAIKNLMKVELASNNNTSQRFNHKPLRRKRLAILLPTDKFIR